MGAFAHKQFSIVSTNIKIDVYLSVHNEFIIGISIFSKNASNQHVPTNSSPVNVSDGLLTSAVTITST
jgi:hypothetical protein